MKKHILGFALFNFIFASFAFISAFFYAPPIPYVAEVKEQTEIKHSSDKSKKTSCFPGKRKNISHEVISSQYFMDEGKVISKIKLVWSGDSAPEKISVNSTFFTLKNYKKNNFGTFQVLENPFSDTNEKIVTIVSRVSDNQRIEKGENLYAFFNVSEGYSTETSAESVITLANSTEVLSVHGNNSIIKK